MAGHTGLLGSAVLRALQTRSCRHVITRFHEQMDLTDGPAVMQFFEQQRPECVFLCAGRAGGIRSNQAYPADYLQINLAIQNSVFQAAHKYETEHVVFYGSSCTYPRLAGQPIKESSLLTGLIEPTSEGYATAKIAGLIACRSYNRQYNNRRFIALLPNSIYGPNDNFDLAESHVLSALIRRFHEAKCNGTPTVMLWGSGRPRREFVYCDDAAAASLFAVENADRLENRHYNIGSGQDFSIKELAEMVCDVVGYDGAIEWDTSRPDGTPRKLLDSSDFRALGWRSEVAIAEGLKRTYEWYLQQQRKRSL